MTVAKTLIALQSGFNIALILLQVHFCASIKYHQFNFPMANLKVSVEQQKNDAHIHTCTFTVIRWRERKNKIHVNYINGKRHTKWCACSSQCECTIKTVRMCLRGVNVWSGQAIFDAASTHEPNVCESYKRRIFVINSCS